MKNNTPGCATLNCCCGPVTDYIDTFDDPLWQCYKGLTLAGIRGILDGIRTYNPGGLSGAWSVSGGQLVYNQISSWDYLCIDAVHMAIPYSMEIILDVAELTPTGSGGAAGFDIRLTEDLNNGGGFPACLGGMLQSSAEIRLSSSSQFRSTVSYPSAPFQLWYRVQVDTDGITTWLWIDGVLASGLTWGPAAKRMITTTTFPFWHVANSPDGKRAWQLRIFNFVGGLVAKFDRIEVHEWDHTITARPEP
jgi:hypothetical protein